MEAAPVKIVLSRKAARYVQASTPREDKLRAARAEVGLEPGEQFTILFLFSQDPDDDLRRRALDTLENLPTVQALQALEQGLAPPVIDLLVRQRRDEEELLVRAVDLAETSDETVAFLAALPHKAVLEAVARNDKRVLRSPAILEALGANPLSSRALVDRILFLFGLRQKRMVSAADLAAPEETAEQPSVHDPQEEDFTSLVSEMEADDLPQDLTEEVEAAPNEKRFDQHNLMATIKQLTIFQKIKLALLGNKEARGILIRDKNKVVSTAAIKNPKITETEVVSFAKSKEMPEAVLRIIAKNRDWTKSYQVQVGLVSNPKAPLTYSLKFVNFLQQRDLRNLAKSRDVPRQVTAAARRLLSQKKGGD
jgi:hypothetical protein